MTRGGPGPVLVALVEAGSLTGLGEGPLLRRYLASGDERAFEILVARHGPTVLGVCRRLLRDPGDVEDAFQATFLILVRKAPTIREPARLGPWLYGVAYRVALRARAGAVRRRRREAARPDLDPATSPDDPDRDELRAVFDEELGALPETYRAPVVLCHLEGCSHEEAAAHLGWPVGTVRSRLFRARARLRTRLERRGYAPSVAILGRGTGLLWPRPEVPRELVRRSIEAASRSSMGKVLTAATVSGPVAALTEGVLTAMWLTKLKVIAVGVLCASVLGTGTVLLGQSRPSASEGLTLVSPGGEVSTSLGDSAREPRVGRPRVGRSGEVSTSLGDSAREPGAAAAFRVSPRELNVRLQLAQRRARQRDEQYKKGVLGLEAAEEARGEVEILKARIDQNRDDLTEEREILELRLEAKEEDRKATEAQVIVGDKLVERYRKLAQSRAVSLDKVEELESKAVNDRLRLAQLKLETGELKLRLLHVERRLAMLAETAGKAPEPAPPSPPAALEKPR